MKITRAVWIVLLSGALQSPLAAQYFGERVQQKGFEQADLFFVPSTLNPLGIGSFKSTTPGLLNDPLLNLAVNPAHLRLDTLQQGYLYADFRSAKTIQDEGHGFTPPWLAYESNDIAFRPYPWLYLNTRKELEPAFSSAYIGAPFPDTQPTLLLGASYQLILQDDKYYSVPQDIYRSVVGTDYAGNRAAASSSIPIVDRYAGEDNMHQRGHFAALFGSYEIPGLGSIGMKLSRVLFDRSGAFGSSNFWGVPSQSSGTSLWSNLESRSQTYGHWELTGGAEVRVNERTSIGATGGWLWGDATQALRNDDSSYYSWANSPYQSLYVSSGNMLEEWRLNGHTLLLGADLTSRLSDRQTLRLVYQHQHSAVSIGLGSGIIDTSYSTYSYTYLDTPVTSTSYSILRDQRSGSGEQLTTTNRVLASLQWQIDPKVNLAFGVQFDWLTTSTNTTETVLARMLSAYQSTSGAYNWKYGNDESKDLLWTFTAERTSLQIPIFLTLTASEAVDFLLGLNRAMTYSRVTDVTLAIFRYRQSDNNGTVSRQENFGERYTTPPSTVSDVRTTFLAGLTAAPSKHFRIRFLMVPNFQDMPDGTQLNNLQWWIGVNILP